MKYQSIKKAATLSLFLTLPASYWPSRVLAQSKGFTLTPIVRRGDSSPDGGRFFNCDRCTGNLAGARAFNNNGDLALAADTVGFCFDGLFLIAEGNRLVLADRCRTTPFGRFDFLVNANLNDRGQAVFYTGLYRDQQAAFFLLLYSDGQMTKIVGEGDPTPVGTTFSGCGFREPSINNKGEVAFHTCTKNSQGELHDELYVFSEGVIRRVVTTGDASPVGGIFVFNNFSLPPLINDGAEILFDAEVGGTSDPFGLSIFGLFLATSGGFRKVVMQRDPLPGGGVVRLYAPIYRSLNSKGEVAFAVNLSNGQSDSGIFLYSEGQITKIVAAGESTPIGGEFDLNDEHFPQLSNSVGPRLNSSGVVAFKSRVLNGHAPSGIFLASVRAILKVAAVGDELITGEKIGRIDTFTLNDLGQVAFFAYDQDDQALGVFEAAPVAPQIKSIKLKRKRGALELRVNGNAMITNDTIIEIDGVPLEETSYPDKFREDGGTNTRVVSTDARLAQLIPSGRTVRVTVFNSLTNLRSAEVTFSR